MKKKRIKIAIVFVAMYTAAILIFSSKLEKNAAVGFSEAAAAVMLLSYAGLMNNLED